MLQFTEHTTISRTSGPTTFLDKLFSHHIFFYYFFIFFLHHIFRWPTGKSFPGGGFLRQGAKEVDILSPFMYENIFFFFFLPALTLDREFFRVWSSRSEIIFTSEWWGHFWVAAWLPKGAVEKSNSLGSQWTLVGFSLLSCSMGLISFSLLVKENLCLSIGAYIHGVGTF